MIAYTYNRSTGEYTGAYKAQLDPIRSKVEEKDIYLLPAYATWISPPNVDLENQQVMWNGEKWIVKQKQETEMIDEIS